MKNDKVKYLLSLLFFIILAAITFRCAFGADMVFSASDVNIGGLAVRKSRVPDLFFGFISNGPVLGTSGYSLSFFNVLVALLPLELFANSFYGLMLISGSLALVWFLRLWGRSWLASVFGALVGFWFNSIMLAASGHVYKIEVLVFSVLSLCLIEKAVRADSLKRSIGFATLAGLTLGIMMIEQQDVALLAGLFVGPYALFRLVQVHEKAAVRWGGILIPVVLVALLFSWTTLIKSYSDNIANASQVQGDGDGKWNYVTQWSMVPSEWPDLVAPGWSGWSTSNPEGPYWGKLGQSAEWESSKQGFQNFKLTSNYLGFIPFLLGVFGLVVAVRNRKNEESSQILFWGVAGVLGFWLAFGKYSILYKLFYQLPMVGNIRAPIKLLDNFQICLGIIAAYGLDQLIVSGKADKTAKRLWIAGATAAGLMLLAGLKVLAFPANWKADFTEMGLGRFADIMLTTMVNAWFHAALFALVAAVLVFLVWKGGRLAKWVAVGFVIILAVDSLILTSHYFKASNISGLKKGNIAVNFIKENQGDERTYLLDQGGYYNQWLAVDRSFHGLNLFNIWQMNRTPSEYKDFLGIVGRNQLRLWELSAVKYVVAPPSILKQFEQNPNLGKLFDPVLNYQVPTAQGMRSDAILEFKGHIPRFALYQNWTVVPLAEQCALLASAQHNPQTTILVGGDDGLVNTGGNGKFKEVDAKLTTSKALLNVQVDAPSVLRFSQRYEPTWQVFVDGEKAKVLKVDFLCMGVSIPSGEHVVEFRCFRATGRVWFSISIFLVSLGTAIVLIARRIRK